MTKDPQRYGATGGWGYEEFNGDGQTERVLSAEAKVACYNCHASQKARDSVFSTFRK